MNLTKYDKETFVSAVMNDVPRVDYDEEARVKVQAWAKSRMPAFVARAFKDHPEWVKTQNFSTPSHISMVRAVGNGDQITLSREVPELWAELEALASLNKAQTDSRWQLSKELTNLVKNLKTLKQLEVALPEFSKYFPKDRETTGATNVPAVNVLASLTAAGWPAGKVAA